MPRRRRLSSSVRTMPGFVAQMLPSSSTGSRGSAHPAARRPSASRARPRGYCACRSIRYAWIASTSARRQADRPSEACPSAPARRRARCCETLSWVAGLHPAQVRRDRAMLVRMAQHAVAEEQRPAALEGGRRDARLPARAAGGAASSDGSSGGMGTAPPPSLNARIRPLVAALVRGRVTRHVGKAAAAPCRHHRHVLHAVHAVGHGRGEDRGARVDRLEQPAVALVEHAEACRRCCPGTASPLAVVSTPLRSCQPCVGTAQRVWPVSGSMARSSET